jgi:L-seryl-tRNA(Ser) seleniumtransferase
MVTNLGKNGCDIGRNLYKELGVRTFVNGRGTWTYLGGALVNPEVKQAMDRAALHTVYILELQKAVGKRIAELVGSEAAMVTCGAGAAISAGTAGCMTGIDPDLVYQLPDTTGMKNEVILEKRSVWDSQIRLTGAQLILAEDMDSLCDSINDNTAMVYWTDGGRYDIEDVLSVCKKSNVPLFLDVASSIPCKDPTKLFAKYAKLGVDLYAFSGGKGLRGPQTSGLLIGRDDLIRAALANCSPWEGAICRSMKAGKEEIIGALVALETYMKRDHEKDWRTWEHMSQRIVEPVNKIHGVKAYVGIPRGNYKVPHCIIEWNQKELNLSTADCLKKLIDGNPPIEVHSRYNPSLVKAKILVEQQQSRDLSGEKRDREWIAVCPIMLKLGEDRIIAERIVDVFN